MTEESLVLLASESCEGGGWSAVRGEGRGVLTEWFVLLLWICLMTAVGSRLMFGLDIGGWWGMQNTINLLPHSDTVDKLMPTIC